MEEYKPNSNKYKNQKEAASEKKVEKPVVSGKVTTKKKSEVRKFADVFVSEDISTVKSYLFTDVFVPAVKNALSEAVKTGIDMILWGEARRGKQSGGSKFNYGGCFDQSSGPRRAGSARRSGFDYDEIVFDSRADAERVLEGMDAIIESYSRGVSVADLYDLADVTNTNFAANKYGWTDIHSARVVRIREGYVLSLPRPTPID